MTRTLVVSQDYELFFGRSGTPQKCLFEPCDALLRVADELGLRITFFVDVGMLLAMRRLSSDDRGLALQADQISRHVEQLAGDGHEIALHIHPHWEDTRIVDGHWQFAGTRYQMRDFPAQEQRDIVLRYARQLGEIAGTAPVSFRAGGFCVEPFEALGPGLLEAGIRVDSSVVPGMHLQDPEKGIDFRATPAPECWRFSDSPTQEDERGDFAEIPVSAQILPLLYYWGRLVRRLQGRGNAAAFGDGDSKRIGRIEILRRLAGAGRHAELSTDVPKSEQLSRQPADVGERSLWQIMGHPKLLSNESLTHLREFVDRLGFEAFATVGEAGRGVLDGSFRPNRGSEGD